MRLFDEVTGSLRPIELRPTMGVYVCGITPYDSAHLGHAFTYVQMDVLVRYLRHLGPDVVHVQNVTDVDDDILRVARERGVDHWELAERESERFVKAMDAIGVRRPTHTPWASEFIPQIIDQVATLDAHGNAYEREGTVYFRVSSYRHYGSLSRLDRDTMVTLSAERGGHPEDPAKEDPLDFVLWQRSRPGEPRWESPWGPGRPGWHIECSTMALGLLGRPIDVHGGGSDLTFPHHESEIAQAECAGAGEFVRHWVHTGAVHMEGEKMSKSLGNMAFVSDLLERHEPAVLRAFLLRRHYREDWTFREADLSPPTVPGRAGGERGAEAPSRPGAEGGEGALRAMFFEALDDDLNAPRALAVLDQAAVSSRDEDRALFDEGMALLGLDL